MSKTKQLYEQQQRAKAAKPAKSAKPASRPEPHRTLYFAYGANTDKTAMAHRCPDAQPAGTMMLADHRLVFRGCADVEPTKGRSVFGALWWITRADERALDRFEGFPHFYRKEWGEAVVDGEKHRVMFYVMTGEHRRDTAPPFHTYEQTLRRGYADFGLPHEQIDLALLECPQPSHRFVTMPGTRVEPIRPRPATASRARGIHGMTDEEFAALELGDDGWQPLLLD